MEYIADTFWKENTIPEISEETIDELMKFIQNYLEEECLK